ncbi:unnamed protein product [Caenorhabditis brenneri]
MEHLNDTEAMHKIFQASNGEPQKVVEIVSAAILEKTNHMLQQMFNPPNPAAPENEPYQLFHPETLPMEVQEKRADGYLELFSVVCKAEEMEIGRMAQEEGQEAIEDELPIQVEPEMQVEEGEEVILPDIEELVEDFEDGIEAMEVD